MMTAEPGRHFEEEYSLLSGKELRFLGRPASLTVVI
jgi:hypothetical protein